jgi:hypothetical protein
LALTTSVATWTGADELCCPVCTVPSIQTRFVAAFINVYFTELTSKAWITATNSHFRAEDYIIDLRTLSIVHTRIVLTGICAVDLIRRVHTVCSAVTEHGQSNALPTGAQELVTSTCTILTSRAPR